MPPWKPSAGVAFHHERRLADKEIATIADWADHGTPAGDPKDALPAKEFTDGWQLGTPDLILTPSDDYVIGAAGKDQAFAGFVMPTGIAQRTKSTSKRPSRSGPGNSRWVVHHLLLFIDATRRRRRSWSRPRRRRSRRRTSDHAGQSEPEDRGPGYSVGMPGSASRRRGPVGLVAGDHAAVSARRGRATILPKNSDIVGDAGSTIPPRRPAREGPDEDRPPLREEAGRERLRLRSHHAGGKRTWRSCSKDSSWIPAGDEAFKLTGERLRSAEGLHPLNSHLAAHASDRQVDQAHDDAPGREGGDAPRRIDQCGTTTWQEIYTLKEPIQVEGGEPRSSKESTPSTTMQHEKSDEPVQSAASGDVRRSRRRTRCASSSSAAVPASCGPAAAGRCPCRRPRPVQTQSKR